MINVLVSYHYMSKKFLEVIKATQNSIRWFLDSGAFSAHTLNKEIILDEYMIFLSENKHLFWQYIALDSIGNIKKTNRNLEVMCSKGLKPMPVLVLNAPITDLEYFKSINSHICIAGGGSMNMKKYSTRLAQARKLIGKDVWFHGLAFGRGMKIISTEVNSVDVSSWMSGRRFGGFFYFHPIYGPKAINWKKARKKPFKELPINMKKAIARIDLTNLNQYSTNSGACSLIASQCVYTYIQFASALQKSNIRFIFACTNTTDVETLLLTLNFSNKSHLDWKKIQKIYEKKVCKNIESFSQYAKQASINNEKYWNIK